VQLFDLLEKPILAGDSKPQAFRLLSGESELTKYLFNTRRNEHYFCKHCGVRPFGIGNAPDVNRVYRVNSGCLENITAEELAAATIVYIDGKHDQPLQASTRSPLRHA
jgi:hypothetical protein